MSDEQQAWLMVEKIADLIADRDSLIAERDEALADLTVFVTCLKHSEGRAEAAEAERDEAQAENSRLRGQLSEIAHTNAPVIRDLGARALAAEARAVSLETSLREIAEGKEREPVKGTTGVSGRPRYRYELAARLRASAALAAPSNLAEPPHPFEIDVQAHDRLVENDADPGGLTVPRRTEGHP